MCNLTIVRSKKKVIDEARAAGATVHFASLMDICHLKNAELEAKHQKYKGRVVLRGDIVKDNSGSYAVFTVQGSSVNGIHPAPDIHEHFTIHKGYGTLRIFSRTFSTILSAL